MTSNLSWTKNMIMGDIAETVAMQMLRDLGLFVERTGQEHFLTPPPTLGKFLANFDSTVWKKLKNDDDGSKTVKDVLAKMPDLVVMNEEGKRRLIEVKCLRTRPNVELHYKEDMIFSKAAYLFVHPHSRKKFRIHLISDIDRKNMNTKELIDNAKIYHYDLPKYLNKELGVSLQRAKQAVYRYGKLIDYYIPKEEFR